MTETTTNPLHYMTSIDIASVKYEIRYGNKIYYVHGSNLLNHQLQYSEWVVKDCNDERVDSDLEEEILSKLDETYQC
jgi:hypothetical protein